MDYKKIMATFAVAGIAAVAGADIVSSSVVGYQNKAINNEAAGGYTWIMSTMPTVGADLDALTLSSWKVTPPDGGLVSEFSVNVVTFDTAGQIAGSYVYLDEVQCGMFGVEPGWYTADSVSVWAPEAAGAVTIESGEMFQIGSDCGATITVPSAL